MHLMFEKIAYFLLSRNWSRSYINDCSPAANLKEFELLISGSHLVGRTFSSTVTLNIAITKEWIIVFFLL